MEMKTGSWGHQNDQKDPTLLPSNKKKKLLFPHREVGEGILGEYPHALPAIRTITNLPNYPEGAYSFVDSYLDFITQKRIFHFSEATRGARNYPRSVLFLFLFAAGMAIIMILQSNICFVYKCQS